MSINFSSLSETLVYMGKGMLGIFIVTAVIILSMMILNKVFSSQSNSDKISFKTANIGSLRTGLPSLFLIGFNL